MSVAIDGPAMSGTCACCRSGAKAITLPLLTVPITVDLVVPDEACDQRHGTLRVRLVVVDDQVDLVLSAGGLVVLDRELDALQVRLAEVDDGRRAAQALHHADLDRLGGPGPKRSDRQGEQQHRRTKKKRLLPSMVFPPCWNGLRPAAADGVSGP